ncbi:Uncharacterized protein APZ42_001661, partial [Daphnia magna]
FFFVIVHFSAITSIWYDLLLQIFKNFVIGSHLDQCSSLRLRNRATCIDLNAIASL